MPRVRFTLRWMMIAVAIAAVILGGATMRRRRASYLKRGAVEAERERRYRDVAEFVGRSASDSDRHTDWSRRHLADVRRMRLASKSAHPTLVGSERIMERIVINSQKSADEYRLMMKVTQGRADDHGDLRRKYENAAVRPWLGVPPDPTEPDWDAMTLAAFRRGRPSPAPLAPK